jgi:hypothetical protein
MIYANNKFLDSEKIITSQIVYGNTSICMEPAQFIGEVNLSDYENRLISYTIDNYDEYVQKSLPFNVTRYVRVINGLETNDYYDVTKDGTILHSENHFNKEDIEYINTLKLLNDADTVFDTTRLDVVENYQDIYFKSNGKVSYIRILNVGDGIKFVDMCDGKEIPIEYIYSTNTINQ